jgi:hypothetical protein
MARIEFDRHAKRRMKARNVSEVEAMASMENPDFLAESLKGRKNAFKFINGRYLRTTYNLDATGNITVITVVARKKPFENAAI